MNKLSETSTRSCSVAVVGGGPAGLALAAELKRLGVNDVVVLEREAHAGGIPRHCGHYPFGVREFGRLLKGPDYARKNVKTALDLGVEIRLETTVTSLHPNGRLSLSTPTGREELKVDRVVLCTGVRESSRAQRLISGDRPLGIMSTGALQSLVYLQGMQPFKNPVILGSELVSFSSIDTCRHLGMRPVAMIEEQNRIVTHRILQTYLVVRGVPLFVSAKSLKIVGRGWVEAIEFIDAHGDLKRLETDGVIISGRFRPEAALLQHSHLEVDPGSGGPVIDQFGRCSDPSYYSAGNLLRPAETAGWCWREGVATAKWITEDLVEQGKKASVEDVKLTILDPAIQFILPQRLSLSKRVGGMDKMQIGLKQPSSGVLQASINDNCIWSARIKGHPVRRIQKPLAEVLKKESGANVKFTIRRDL